ncbi:MAG: GNAT family N-acetyltransferase [Gammaproteobacteria bacterium]|nr:GNAT family N-acetyltransferase [Gammaproteobacteria bacterium]
MIDQIQLITTPWKQNQRALKQIRTTVFIEEQHVPVELEWDKFDDQSIHFLVLHDNKPIATARLKPDGQIGRMAVIKNCRNRGVGSKLLSTILQEAKDNGYSMVYLHAQKNAINFYSQFNFIQNGTEFIDADIKHRAMYKLLNINNDQNQPN